jgi:inner membrane protein
MQKKLFFKLVIVFGLMVAIGIALAMIGATVASRAEYRAQAVANIATESVGPQLLSGPVLVVPYDFIAADAKGNLTTTAERMFVFPSQLDVKGAIQTDRRYRGLHQVLVYGGQYMLRGTLKVPGLEELHSRHPQAKIQAGRPYLALHIGDVRGIRHLPTLKWDGEAVKFSQSSRLTAHAGGVHASLPAIGAKDREVGFEFALGLDGIERQDFVPLSDDTSITLTSPWPHPQFGGRFLPDPRARSISEKGFSATWRISSLATNAQQIFLQREISGATGKDDPASDAFGVSFIEPVNIYLMAQRAVEYGLLFVALTFAAFFLFEVLRRLPIHPVQYGLVGLALAMFFLLLLSLSEHIDFVMAYLIASIACIGLISYYLAAVLGGWLRGAAFGLALSLLYGALYGLLISESNALVLGSLLLFAILSGIMVATRKIDWYRLGAD